MPSASELRAELKVMRETHPDHKPVSKMKKADVAHALERMKMMTETTPAIAMTRKEAPAMMKSESAEKPKKASKKEKVVEPESESDVEEAPKKSVMKVEKKKDGAPAPAPEKAKESMKDRMARIRALKGKKKD